MSVAGVARATGLLWLASMPAHVARGASQVIPAARMTHSLGVISKTSAEGAKFGVANKGKFNARFDIANTIVFEMPTVSLDTLHVSARCRL